MSIRDKSCEWRGEVADIANRLKSINRDNQAGAAKKEDKDKTIVEPTN